MPLIIGIADYLSGRVDGSDQDALLASVGVEMVPGTDEGRILENSVFAAGTFAPCGRSGRKCHRRSPLSLLIRKDIAPPCSNQKKVRGRTAAKGDVAAELARLRATGWALGIATNDTINSTQLNLEDMGIAGAFDVVICADSGFGRKPEAGGLLEACRATGWQLPMRSWLVIPKPTGWPRIMPGIAALLRLPMGRRNCPILSLQQISFWLKL